MDWLYQMLDMAVVEQVAPLLWQPRTPTPAWFRWLGGAIESLGEEFAFLDFFVPEAFRLREESGTARVRSEIWTQVNTEGRENAFRAEAFFGEHTVLLIQQVNRESVSYTHLTLPTIYSV